MRSFIILFFFSTLLFGKDIIEVFARYVLSTKDYLTATGDVVLLYDGALLKSDKATYDKNSSLLTLTGEVEVIKEDDNKIYSELLEINTTTKVIEFKKLLITTDDDLWIDAPHAQKENEKYKIFDSQLSSCNTQNPEWTIDFAEATYNKNKNYMTLSDAKLTFFDLPIFYFPYLAFPTANERTSGLLFPFFQFSSTEGFAYQQPIFYAPVENFDMEFNPQIRTNRGLGGHITTRFVDSPVSQGRLRVGYFKNFESYAKENNFNTEHYGLEFLYASSDFLPESTFLDHYKSGFYVNANYLNDLEYLNLQQSTAGALIATTFVESQMNAFMYDEKDYLGLYARYNIDLSKSDNHDTIQQLPGIQYHKFISYLVSDKLFYTFDARVHNYTRVRGSRAYQTEFDLPVTYYDSFFNDYLDVSVTENLYLSDVYFSNLTEEKDNYRFYRNYHTVELSSDISKQYGANVHTLHPSIIYTKPSFERERPTQYKDLSNEQKELFVTQTELENLNIGLSQYYYNSELDMNLFHRLAFTQYPNEVFSRGDINNEFGYTLDNFSYYSNMFYSLDKEKIHSLTNSLTYAKSDYSIALTHFYNYNLITDEEETSFLNGALTYNYNKHNQIYTSSDFDLKNSFNHQWSFGWSHQQKCWGAKVSLGQEQIPNLNTSFKNSMLYFELSFNPIGAISRNVEKEFSTPNGGN